MATIKSYTSLEQSKKLAEILPIDSADMAYDWVVIDREYSTIPYCRKPIDDELPCWSLSALLNVLDFPCLIQENENEWKVVVFDNDNDDYIEETASNSVDACYEMILKLHQQKLI